MQPPLTLSTVGLLHFESSSKYKKYQLTNCNVLYTYHKFQNWCSLVHTQHNFKDQLTELLLKHTSKLCHSFWAKSLSVGRIDNADSLQCPVVHLKYDSINLSFQKLFSQLSTDIAAR